MGQPLYIDKKARQSNIELLRIIMILGVIILHYNNSSMGGGFNLTKDIPVNYYTLYFFEYLFICGVNVFIIISGYFLVTTQTRNLLKPFSLIVEVILIRICYYLIQLIKKEIVFSKVEFISSLLPANYFVIIYCALYLLSPYLNIMLNALSEKQLLILFALLFVLFSVEVTVVDLLSAFEYSVSGLSTVGLYGSQDGYTIINFIMMYCFGGIIRKTKIKDIKLLYLLAIYIVNLALLAILDMFIYKKTDNYSLGISYCNPFVVIESVSIFLIFTKIKIRESRVINSLSKGSFTVFLLHRYFFEFFQIEKYAVKSVWVMLLNLVITVIGAYTISIAIYYIYNFFASVIEKAVAKKCKWLKYEIKFNESVEEK